MYLAGIEINFDEIWIWVAILVNSGLVTILLKWVLNSDKYQKLKQKNEWLASLEKLALSSVAEVEAWAKTQDTKPEGKDKLDKAIKLAKDKVKTLKLPAGALNNELITGFIEKALFKKDE